MYNLYWKPKIGDFLDSNLSRVFTWGIANDLHIWKKKLKTWKTYHSV